MRVYRYKGHRYRLAGRIRQAQEPAADEPQAEEKDERVTALENLSLQYLQKHNITGTPLKKQPKPEADGRDIVIDVGQQWSGVTALMTFDYRLTDAGGQLVELVLELCGSFYVAHKDAEIQQLLNAFGILNKAEFFPQTALNVVQDKRKDQYLTFLEYWVGEMLKSGQELPDNADYNVRQQFIKAVEQLAGTKETPGPIPADRVKNLMDGARMLSDDEWTELIDKLENQGPRYMSKQEMVNKAVGALTAHEKYTGKVHILGSNPEGEIITAIDVPPPMQSFMFVLANQPGQNELKVAKAALGVCGSQFLSVDEGLTKQLLTAMVDLLTATNVDQDPELSKPPEIEAQPEWTEKKLLAAFRKGLVLWKMEPGWRIGYKNETTVCYSDEEWNDSKSAINEMLRTHLARAQQNNEKVFRVDSEGRVDELNYNLQVIASNIARFDSLTQKMQCKL